MKKCWAFSIQISNFFATEHGDRYVQLLFLDLSGQESVDCCPVLMIALAEQVHVLINSEIFEKINNCIDNFAQNQYD